MNSYLKKIISKGIIASMIVSMPLTSFAKSEETGLSKEIKKVEANLKVIENRLDLLSDEMDDYFDRIEDQIEGKKVKANQYKEDMTVTIKKIDVVSGEILSEETNTTTDTYKYTPTELEGYKLLNKKEIKVAYKPGKKISLVIKYKNEDSIKPDDSKEPDVEETPEIPEEPQIPEVPESSEDISQEIDEDLTGKSFRDKLNTIKNSLDLEKNQVDLLSESEEATEDDLDDIENLYDDIKDIEEDIQEQIEDIDEFQEEIAEKMKEKDQKEYKAKKDKVSKDKVWSVKFNGDISEETLSGLNIFIIDNKKNIVHVKTKYNSLENSLEIIPDEDYIKGRKYTLFISKELKNKKGKSLNNAVKMDFTIE